MTAGRAITRVMPNGTCVAALRRRRALQACTGTLVTCAAAGCDRPVAAKEWGNASAFCSTTCKVRTLALRPIVSGGRR